MAKAYGLQPWQLLIPQLDPLDPPVTIGAQRMSVLRSVFAQVHANANTPTSPTEHAQAGGAKGGVSGDPRDRARAGGAPLVRALVKHAVAHARKAKHK